MSITKVTYAMIEGAVANVMDFGATGDGSTNDTVAIQAAIDSLAATGGTVFFPTGEYLIARNIGTNDRWGIKILNSNISLVGTGNGTKMRRFNTDISTYALAYPLVFVGTPDSNVAAATENVTIEGIQFIGQDTQHSVGGSVIHDFRNAIEAKNTKNLVVQNNLFVDIDCLHF
jgi:polygalacturonase